MAQGSWLQGTYNPINREKYIGVKNPIFRSSWEKRMFYYCDTNSNVLKWGSEIINVPYYFVLDQKTHKYYTDLYMEVRKKDGSIKKYVVEIKPSDQDYRNPPKPPKRKTTKSMKNYNNKLITLKRNECKWKAAEEFCKKRGYEFIIITEKDLFP